MLLRSGQKHGQWMKLALKRIKQQPQGFERHRSKERAISSFAKNNGRGSPANVDSEEHVTDMPAGLRAVCQSENAARMRLHSKLAQRAPRHDRVHRA